MFTACDAQKFLIDRGSEQNRKEARTASIADQACEAVFAKWEPQLLALGTAGQEMRRATDAGNWQQYRDAWDRAFPIIQKLELAAQEHRQLVGAENVLHLYNEGLGYSLQNAGLGATAALKDAVVTVDAALKGRRASAAATVLVLVAEQSVTRGREFVHSLAVDASDKVMAGYRAQIAAAGAARKEQLAGDSFTSYFSGIGLRLASVYKPFLTLLLLVVVVGSYLGAKARRNPVTSAVRAGAAYLLPGAVMSVALVFAPFLGEWILLGSALAATVAMYIYGSQACNAMANKLAERSPAVATQLRSCGRFMSTLADEDTVQKRAPGARKTDHDSHGTARWGTAAELRMSGHLAPPNQAVGFALARISDAPAGLDQRMRHVGHVVTVAPTGAGKGIGAVIPTLLEHPGSALVIDPKGENSAVTARARRELGQRVFVVDPFGVTDQGGASCNVLDRLDLSTPDCVSESAVLADSLVVVSGKKAGGDDHWDESAKTLLQGLMLHVVGLDDPERRTLGEVRRLLTASEDTLLELLAEMAADDSVAFGLPGRAANTVMGMADRERGSVLSTARRHTAFLDDPRIASALARSDFDLGAIKSELMTIYLVMPANRIAPNARFLRLFVGSVIAAITASSQQPPHRVAFVLDEFAQLGYMRQIEDAVSLMRGYGLSFWVFLQDLSQLKAVYPRWQTFLANSAKTFFGVDDFDTAKYVSESLGQATVEYETHNKGRSSGSNSSLSDNSSSGGYNRGASSGTSQQIASRALLTPDEVMRLGTERPIVLVRGLHPILATRLNYLTDGEYAGRADPNPYHT